MHSGRDVNRGSLTDPDSPSRRMSPRPAVRPPICGRREASRSRVRTVPPPSSIDRPKPSASEVETTSSPISDSSVRSQCTSTWGSVVTLCIQSRVRSRPSTRSVNSAWTFVEVPRCLTPHSAESRLGRTVALGRGFVVVRQLLSAGKVSRQLISAGRWLLDGFVVRACFGHDSTVELGARARSRG